MASTNAIDARNELERRSISASDAAADSDEVGIVEETMIHWRYLRTTCQLASKWDPSAELIGSRTESAKTYLGEDGERVTLLAHGPVHYLEDGSWEDIDLNMVSTADGWEVTKNTFETQFSDETGAGISVQVHPNVTRSASASTQFRCSSWRGFQSHAIHGHSFARRN